ncbi:sugar phosphate isomerase/epimerase [Candidatus Peregrinibacteria bacterium]|nr:sugar phosphate isomerase/epimerase [Candidatus Peregrinibacteria bacterium]
MITLSTDSLRGYGLNRIFQFVKEANYDGVDLYLDPHDFDTQDAEYIKLLVNQFKLPVIAIQTPPNATPKMIVDAVTMAKKIDTKVIIVQPPKMFNFKYIKWLTYEVPKIRQREEISIALENAPSDTFLGIIPEHAMNNLNELRKFKHAALDTTRVAQKKDDLIRVYNILRKYLVHVHVSNVKKGKGYAMPGEGILPLESFLTKLKQEGYRGAVSFKIHPRFLGAGNHKDIMENMAECKKFYEDYFVKIETLPGIVEEKKAE